MIQTLTLLWRRLARKAWPELVPPATGLYRHSKGGVYESYGQHTYKGTRFVTDYDHVSLIVMNGQYAVVDYDRRHMVATVQAHHKIRPGDPVVVYQGSDNRFWIRAHAEFHQKFTELERY